MIDTYLANWKVISTLCMKSIPSVFRFELNINYIKLNRVTFLFIKSILRFCLTAFSIICSSVYRSSSYVIKQDDAQELLIFQDASTLFLNCFRLTVNFQRQILVERPFGKLDICFNLITELYFLIILNIYEAVCIVWIPKS